MNEVEETFEQKMRRSFAAIQGVEIPKMPKDIIELDKEINSRYPNTINMVDIISGNTILAAELLKLANWPTMRQASPIVSISQAVTVLGTKKLKNLLLSAALKELMGTQELVQDIMDHAIDVALCAAELAHNVQGVDPDEAYVCGLFHNCGAILLAMKDEVGCQKIFRESHTHPLTSIAKEEALYNTNHTLTGILLAKKWQLAESVIQTIYYHHEVDCTVIEDDHVRLLVALLKVANGIVAEISLGSYIGAEMHQCISKGMDTLLLQPEHLRDARIMLQSRQLGLT